MTLAPLSFLYGCAVRVRNHAFDSSRMRVRGIPVPAICIGSLFAGGTGKTPFAAYLANLAHSQSWSPLLVAHGHAAPRAGARLIADGRGMRAADWRRDGDETVLLTQLAPRIPIVVARERRECLAAAARAAIGPDFVIFDGGFQDRALFRDLDIVLLDASCSPERGRLLPLGEMREPWAQLRRAAVLVLHRAELCRDRERWESHLARVAPGRPILWSRNRWNDPCELGGDRTIEWNEIRTLRLGVWTGIGRPESFLAGLAQRGITPSWCELARDHAPLGKREVERIGRAAQEANLDALIVTAKDAIKMETFRDRLPPVWCVRAAIEMEAGEELLRRYLARLRTARGSEGR